MTKLLKNIKRELLASPDFKGRPVIVELQAGDRISFRLKGKKKRYEVSLHKVFLLAMLQTLEGEYQDKLDIYNMKKKAGYPRLRKPRKPSFSMFTIALRKILSLELKLKFTENK